MSKKTKYSIIIPVFNRKDELKELLESLYNQSYRDFEIIIVDDGSIEQSKKIYDLYKLKFQIQYYFIENSGPAKARNFGVTKSLGDWVIFFDSDCTVPKNYFFEVEKFLNENKIDFYGGPDMADDKFTLLQKSISFSMTSFITTGGIRGGDRSVDKFLPRSYNMGVKKKYFEEVGGFSDMRYGEDLDLSYKLIYAKKKSALIINAKVFHKRRTNLIDFFFQIFNSGKARYLLNQKHKNSKKIFHLFPTIFLILIMFSIIPINMNGFKINELLGLIYLLYFAIIFLSSTFLFKSPIVGFMSIITTIVQFTGYGIGYVVSYIKS